MANICFRGWNCQCCCFCSDDTIYNIIDIYIIIIYIYYIYTYLYSIVCCYISMLSWWSPMMAVYLGDKKSQLAQLVESAESPWNWSRRNIPQTKNAIRSIAQKSGWLILPLVISINISINMLYIINMLVNSSLCCSLYVNYTIIIPPTLWGTILVSICYCCA